MHKSTSPTMIEHLPKLRGRGYPGTLSPEESLREKEHRKIARRAAAEGIVLLENNGVLPLRAGSSIALYGSGARYTVKGGTGSGSVNNRSSVTIDEGLRNAGFVITTDQWLDDYDKRYAACKKDWTSRIYELAGEPGNFDALYRAHASNPMISPAGADVTPDPGTDTAIFVINRISGEGADRKAQKGDYYLSDEEYKTLKQIASLYADTIVVLNVGGIIDLSFLDEMKLSALVLLSQAGMEGGNALADVLLGEVNPSGKLTDTWAYEYQDYPCSATFSHNNGNVIEEKYSEGIFVGYRYFDTFRVRPRYPFGYGLSYTTFSMTPQGVTVTGHSVNVLAKVRNTGTRPGKEVVQLYVSCPSAAYKKEAKRLTAFGKTALLAPGEEEALSLTFDLSQLTFYRAGKAAYYLEKGTYYLLIGASGAETTVAGCLTLDEAIEVETLTNICPLLDALKEMEPSDDMVHTWETELASAFAKASAPSLSIDEAAELLQAENAKHAEKTKLSRQMDDADRITELLTLSQKAAMVCGRPKNGPGEIIGNAAVTVPGAAGETSPILTEGYHIGSIVLADGPAGIRLQARYEENPGDGSVYTMTAYQSLENRIFGTEFLHEGSVFHHQYCTAIPIGTLLAQSFDLQLMEEVGKMIGRELEEFGVTLWLAPGMNIHRNPLCGRNFEYYSEDPLLSGRMAAALTRGVQQIPGVGTTIKHFACNNQEENRRGVNSIVSERALREIYLKGFEIAVRESQPMAIMTSYNKINGVHTANSYDLCTTAARKEWGFQGLIMTDWTTTNASGGSSAAKCIAAGNDLIMPGSISDIQEIIDAVRQEKDQSLDEDCLDTCVARVIRTVLHSNIYE